MKKEAKNKLEAVSHLIVGILLFVKGYDKLSHHFIFTGIIILSMSLIIISYFIYLSAKKIHDKKLELAVHIAEGVALLFTSYVYWETGKQYLPYATGIAGIGYLIAAVIRWRKHNEKDNTAA